MIILQGYCGNAWTNVVIIQTVAALATTAAGAYHGMAMLLLLLTATAHIECGRGRTAVCGRFGQFRTGFTV